MRILLIVTLYNILPGIQAQLEFTNIDLGDFHFHGHVGQLPTKYTPLTEQDQHVSQKAEDFVDFIQLVPKGDPLEVPLLPPVGIDLPFLWLTGKVFMKNFILAGIKQLVVHNVELRMENIRTDLNMSFPLLHVAGEFNLQASLSIIPLSMTCYLSLNIMDVDVVVSSGSTVRQASGVGDVLQITSTDVKIDVRNVQFNITDVVIWGSNDDVGDAIIQLFNRKSSGGGVFDGVLKTILDMVNTELMKVPTEVFTDYLLATGY